MSEFNPANVHINTYSVWMGFVDDLAVQDLIADYGLVALAYIQLIYTACAKQQQRMPYCMLDVSNGYAALARTCHFDSEQECKEFVERLIQAKLLELDSGYLFAPSVIADWHTACEHVERGRRKGIAGRKPKQENDG